MTKRSLSLSYRELKTRKSIANDKNLEISTKKRV